MRKTAKERFDKFAQGRTRIAIWVEDETFARFSAAAAACKVSKSRLLRELIDSYLMRVEDARRE